MCSMRALPNTDLVEAIRRRDLVAADEAAQKLERVEPEHALALVLLMAGEQDARYEPAMVRWLGLWLARHPGVGLELAADLIDAPGGVDRRLAQRGACTRGSRAAVWR
jgi:hypothetical protein